MRINLDEMREQVVTLEYTLTCSGDEIRFVLDFHTMKRIEDKLGKPLHLLFLELFDDHKTYNFLVEIIEAATGYEGLEKKIRWTARNIAELDKVLLQFAYEHQGPSFVEKYVETRVERLLKGADSHE